MTQTRRHLVSAYVQDVPGVTIRIAMVFARRGYNIESFVGSETITPGFSTINIVASGDAKVLNLIIDQLNRLVNVVEAKEVEPADMLIRELALIKISLPETHRAEAVMIAQSAGCNVLEIHADYMNLECTGPSETIDGVLTIFSEFGIQAVVRTGKVFLPK